jgi:hypothetical protein
MDGPLIFIAAVLSAIHAVKCTCRTPFEQHACLSCTHYVLSSFQNFVLPTKLPALVPVKLWDEFDKTLLCVGCTHFVE